VAAACVGVGGDDDVVVVGLHRNLVSERRDDSERSASVLTASIHRS
jgi:hypothetical protein